MVDQLKIIKSQISAPVNMLLLQNSRSCFLPWKINYTYWKKPTKQWEIFCVETPDLKQRITQLSVKFNSKPCDLYVACLFLQQALVDTR